MQIQIWRRYLEPSLRRVDWRRDILVYGLVGDEPAADTGSDSLLTTFDIPQGNTFCAIDNYTGCYKITRKFVLRVVSTGFKWERLLQVLRIWEKWIAMRGKLDGLMRMMTKKKYLLYSLKYVRGMLSILQPRILSPMNRESSATNKCLVQKLAHSSVPGDMGVPFLDVST